MSAPVPKRAVTLDISIQADTREEMVRALWGVADRIQRQEMTRGCSGGWGSGFTYNYEENDRPTHDEYEKQLKDWLAEARANPPSNTTST